MDQQKKNCLMKKLEINSPEHWVIFLNKIHRIYFMENYIEKVKTSWGYYIGEKILAHRWFNISIFFYNYIFFKRDKHLKKNNRSLFF